MCSSDLERTEELSVANQQLKEKIVDGELLQEEQLKLQKQLFQAQKMEVIGLMAGGVAHDLNNILMGIVAYPEILLSELPEDSQFREPIISIQEAGQRAADVVADLLTVARGVAASKEFLDIHILIQEYMVSLEHQRIQKLYPNITFETKFEPGPLYIYCSSVHIKKCLMNLAVNAAEAITNSGSITISTAKIRDDGPVSDRP